MIEGADLRVGTIVSAAPLEGARKPAYRLTIDFGPELGTKNSSAQITDLYEAEALVGRQVVAVVNLGSRSIAGFTSEVLTTGLPDESGRVVLIGPDRPVPNGSALY